MPSARHQPVGVITQGFHGFTLEIHAVPEFKIDKDPEPEIMVCLAFQVLIQYQAHVVRFKDPQLGKPGLGKQIFEKRLQIAAHPQPQWKTEALFLSVNEFFWEIPCGHPLQYILQVMPLEF